MFFKLFIFFVLITESIRCFWKPEETWNFVQLNQWICKKVFFEKKNHRVIYLLIVKKKKKKSTNIRSKADHRSIQIPQAHILLRPQLLEFHAAERRPNVDRQH